MSTSNKIELISWLAVLAFGLLVGLLVKIFGIMADKPHAALVYGSIACAPAVWVRDKVIDCLPAWLEWQKKKKSI